MEDLFSSIEQNWFELPNTNECFWVKRHFLNKNQADDCFSMLHDELRWHSESLNMYGKQVISPRKVAWYGEPDACYQYSGQLKKPLAWHPKLSELRDLIEQETGCRFNSVLANLYRDGHDSVGWHSDDEAELGQSPSIASLSLGAARFFDFRDRQSKSNKQRIELTSGSLLLMKQRSQLDWEHQVPKQLKIREARINLTFRWIHSE